VLNRESYTGSSIAAGKVFQDGGRTWDWKLQPIKSLTVKQLLTITAKGSSRRGQDSGWAVLPIEVTYVVSVFCL
jgi:hypothetical protein